MKPVFQTIVGAPLGNCLQACVASIFEVALSDVPNFMIASEDSWRGVFCDFMVSRFGVLPIITEMCFTPPGWHLIVGRSLRGDYDHALVAYRGNPLHDPLPGGGCQLGERRFYIVFVTTCDEWAGLRWDAAEQIAVGEMRKHSVLFERALRKFSRRMRELLY